MKCPKCNDTALRKSTVKSRNLQLDQCPQCKGIWFDNNEFEILLAHKAEKNLCVPNYAVEKKAARCPKCQQSLFEFCYPGTMTLVDVCKSCNGIWLDNSEWKEISIARSVENQMYCPKCATRQAKSDSCVKCGVVFAKYAAAKQAANMKTDPPRLKTVVERESYAKNIPGIKGRMLRFIDRSIETLTDY